MIAQTAAQTFGHDASRTTTVSGIRALDIVFQDGQFVPLLPLELPDGTQLILQITGAAPGAAVEHEPAPSDSVNGLTTVAAIAVAGAIRPVAPIDLAEGTRLRLEPALVLTLRATVQRADGRSATGAALAGLGRIASAGAATRPGRLPSWPQLAAGLCTPLGQRSILALLTRGDLLLLSLTMLVYGLVRFIGLRLFPIYFFSDEAIHTNLGVELFHNGLRDSAGTFLPPYFRNVEKWNLSLSVYLQGLSALLFGQSVLVNRATSASIALLAGIAVALMLRLVFRLRLWWTGPLVLSALPVWFLHSRTSFETVMMVAFYACFLCSYMLYRYQSPRYLIPAIVFGAATFYSYANGQGVMFVSSMLLLLSDLPYHLRTLRARPRVLGAALLTLALVGTQYVRFRLLYPDALGEHLRIMSSVWTRNIPLADKLATFGRQYLIGLSPNFWFAPDNGIDLDRHTFKGWGNLGFVFFPLLLIGLVVCLRKWRSSAHRAILIAILAAPFSAALAIVHSYRVLAMVIPAALLICLGIEWLTGWLAQRRVSRTALVALSAVLLVGINVALLRTALADGPTWYSDYRLYGMQYGSAQVFGAIKDELLSHPESAVEVSPDWANNPNAFVPFFLPEALRGRVAFRSSRDLLTWKQALKPTTIYVYPADEYEDLLKSNKLVVDAPSRVLPYPNGQPGFYFVHMRYVDTIDAIFAAEREARRKLVADTVALDGQTVVVKHSLTDLGTVADLFDNDHATLLRGFEANPMVIELNFPQPRSISAIGLDFWRVDLGLTVTVVPEGGAPQTVTQEYRKLPEDPHVDLALPNGPVTTRTLRIELRDLSQDDVAKIHIPGIQLR